MDWDLFGKILLSIIEIAIAMGVGALARRLGYIREEDLNRWSHLVIDFLFPAFVFHAIVTGLQPDRLGEAWPLPLLGFGMMALGGALGYPLRMILRSSDPDVRKTFHHFCAVNNYGFLPLVLVANLWGKQELALLFLLNLGSSIAYWTVGVGLLGGSNLRQAARSILTPSLAALFMALGVSVSGVAQWLVPGGEPGVLLKVCGSLGGAAVPMILVLIGASMYGAPLMNDKRDLAWLTFVRLILLPAATIAVLRVLPLSNSTYNLALIVSLMPAAMSSTILTRRFGGSPNFAAAAAVITTVLSIATIPLGCLLLR